MSYSNFLMAVLAEEHHMTDESLLEVFSIIDYKKDKTIDEEEIVRQLRVKIKDCHMETVQAMFR
jgi:Ca2+-binding EF-hand superfamily protein